MAMKKGHDVDKSRLYAALKQRGASAQTASRAFGYNDGFLSNACYEGKLTDTTVILLEKVYGIKEEDFAPVKKQDSASTKPAETIDYDKLYQTIYTAVYHAYRQVFIDRKNGKF